MKIPYTLNFGDKSISRPIQAQSLPEWCRYPLSFAKERLHFQIPQLEIVSQRLNNTPFFVDLVEINVKQAAYIPFDIYDRQLFLYFMLKGNLLYTTEEYRPIIRTQANTFLMSYNDTGRYFAHAKEGKHIALVVNIIPKWIESMYHDYQNLQQILHRFKHDDRSYDTMYQCRMDRHVHRWLYKISSYSWENIGALDGNLRKYISYLLEHYDGVLETENDLAYKIKEYIQEHYCDVEINVKFLAERFFATERTLLNIFKRQYHMSVQEFITELRITCALQMMEQGLEIKEVYMVVGYLDERTFRSALERYLKRKR